MAGIAHRPVTVVTGGGSGIGAALARAAASRGSLVAVADIDEAAAREVADEVGGLGVRCDVSQRADLDDVAAAVSERWGRADLLINNAGVGSHGRLVDTTADDWRWMMGITFDGVVNGVAAFLPLLERSEHGRIVNVASMSAVSPLPGLGAYAAAKSAVLAYSEVLSAELAEAGSAITVSVALPGPVRTRIATSMRNRRAGDEVGLVDVELPAASLALMIEPDIAAERILREAEAGEPYIATHPQLGRRPQERFAAILRAFDDAPA
ncbi:SDR family NAD(P)-dependent oxidoreductase [Microbacterium sp. NPDC091313]